MYFDFKRNDVREYKRTWNSNKSYQSYWNELTVI